MNIYLNKKNTPANKHRNVRNNLELNKTIGIVINAEFTIDVNDNWASDIINQNAEIKTAAQTTAILFPKVPGMLMKWWEN